MELAVRAECPDTIIHLGDHVSDAYELGRIFQQTAMLCVSGNCDFVTYDEPAERVADFFGTIVYMMHGHTKGVKRDINRAIYAAEEQGADIVLFGHTHIPYCDTTISSTAKSGRLLVMNPGAAGGGSYGVIELEGGKIKGRLGYI